ncbi:hypothetical protein TcarDRAFT_1206 [Thermosinus carboxydivorans Nor1]|uniref:Uncharacterized protein n=1 Tax=Thermosinus carboxydivorans Nor1 TaxID=401526 RepID=A1HQ94_9FIRM|nr:hypothetical protein TcarDRAFT_1206 [Thermosinus carboxydivorans Nor1]
MHLRFEPAYQHKYKKLPAMEPMSKARFCWQHYDFKKLEKVQEVIKNLLKTAETASRKRAITEVWRYIRNNWDGITKLSAARFTGLDD